MKLSAILCVLLNSVSCLFNMQDALRDTEDHDLGHAMSHFFNCFIGKVQAVSAKGVANSTHSKNQKKVYW